jgi:hypothetical protein
MEFTGPYRDLLQRMYDRCVQLGWFGPEIDVLPDGNRYTVRGRTYCALLSPEALKQDLPFLDQYEYMYDLKKQMTTIKSASDRRFRQFGHPSASAEQIAETESVLGFPLPPLLRAIYMQLANGGFGYWQGFVGCVGGADSGELESIDKGTIHASWKLTDHIPDGLVGSTDVYKCYELPDRFIPWTDLGCAMHCWIDGWSGRIYRSGHYDVYDWPIPEEDPGEPFTWIESEIGQASPHETTPLAYYPQWQNDDTAECVFGEADISTVPSLFRDVLCLGIQYEAPSLEAWIEKWLQSPLP